MRRKERRAWQGSVASGWVGGGGVLSTMKAFTRHGCWRKCRARRSLTSVRHATFRLGSPPPNLERWSVFCPGTLSVMGGWCG